MNKMEEEIAVIRNEVPATQITEKTKTSIECLREAKPYQDISVVKDKNDEDEKEREIASTKISSNEVITKDNQDYSKIKENKGSDHNNLNKVARKDSSKIETVFEKLDITTDKVDSITDSAISAPTKDKEGNLRTEIKAELVPPLHLDVKGRSSEPKSGVVVEEVDMKRNACSLYSVRGTPSGRLNRRRDISSTVFPVGCMGCKENSTTDNAPSPRRFLDANEASLDYAGHMDKTPKKKPSADKQDISNRNPLTGEGMEVTESRRQCIKRKDGNPLLGTGYEKPSNTSTSSARIPPGGYSKGLW